MNSLIAGLQYVIAVLVGLVIAVLPTLLVSWAILPSDGPVGEGLFILFIHFLASCLLVPAYVYLMTLHRQGPKFFRRLFIYELVLRTSVIVASCFVGFMAVKLPTTMETKVIACFITALLSAWALIPSLWSRTSWQNQPAVSRCS